MDDKIQIGLNMNQFLKKYLNKLAALLKENKIIAIILICLIIFLSIISVNEKLTFLLVIKFLIILLILSYILQFLLLIRKNYLFYIIKVTLIVLICFEVFTGIANSYKKKAIRIRGNYISLDPILGYKFKPNINSEKTIKIYKRDTISIGIYSSDNWSRRISEELTSYNNKDITNNIKHAIFLGCSYTFGEGLPYHSTFPFIFEKLNPNYKSYNYGFQGYGPHQISLFFNEGINTINNSTVKENNGFALYTYINDHLNRVYGGSSYLSYAFMTPDVFIINDKLVIKQRSKTKSFFALLISFSETMKYFNISFSYPKTEKFYKRFADIITYIARKYWEIKPQGNFYIGIYPQSITKDTAWIKFIDKNIKILYINSPSDLESNENYYINLEADRHPSKLLNTYYVNEIMKYIN